jgi:preprotein translocase subunit SecA
MTHDIHAATQTLNEQYKTIDQLRHELAQERELADQLKFCIQSLMKDYINKDLDPRTDDAVQSALALYRDNRNYQLPN